MISTRDAGFWLLLAIAAVTLFLFIAASIVVLCQAYGSTLRWSHLALLGIFALLIAMMVGAILKARQPD